MNIPKQFIKPFPAYKEVFYDNLEQHKKHFLPICSINLQCIEPEWNQWLHVVSAKEIHEGCVGDFTQPFHTNFTKEDTLGFDVVDGKYKFEADWNYFKIEQNPSEIVEKAYVHNEKDYQIRKEFFQRNQKIFPYSSFGKEFTSVEAVEAEFVEKQTNGWGLDYPKINEILDDIHFMTEEGQELLEDCTSEDEIFDYTNLLYVPKDEDGHLFTYIGFTTGYFFQAYGADRIYLFFNKELRKAVICFEYT
ncbi:siderophore biosynthesis protein [Bacillus pseudomycoides]|uniref:siderophore biosynthesis protein n=1 Tax=Bacillus pseudomycoides TaxID=64104 RepID=UPI000BF0F7D6|nr:siderophore biosynthesis protein [Bacillus pseudomycoides]PEJ35469.1 siderophore biosynthesis protein [Bacillus pseudomycoides]PHA80607.1 siderophore biosynthesis protein [Bacillus pseudomycoides]PHC78607.1 siderophore biosynthesis protein [Bacillus pseudomycoides]